MAYNQLLQSYEAGAGTVADYVFVEYPKWVNGVVVADADEEAAVIAAAIEPAEPDDKPRRGRPPKTPE